MTREPLNQGLEEIAEKGSRLVLNKDFRTLPQRCLTKACGVIDSVEDIECPLVTIIDAHSTHIPGHVHLDKLTEIAIKRLKEVHKFKVEVSHVGGAVCDGKPMGKFGMKYSLQSRELIADQVETDVGAHATDGVFLIGNCDKIVPGMLMGLARVNVPGLYLSGGPMLAGRNGTDLVNGPFEDVGKVQSKHMDLETAVDRANHACEGFGSCSGMFTANTMNCLAEALGLAVPGNGTVPAAHWTEDGKYELNPERIKLTEYAVDCFAEMVKKKIKPLDILTKESFDNAMKVDLAIGGSTNSALHVPAIAYEAGIEYTLKDIDKASRITPHLSKLSPSRPDAHVEDFDRAGGVSTIIKELSKIDNLISDQKTVTGKSLLENVADAPAPDGDIIMTRENAYSPDGGMAVLYGNLAPRGSVIKTAGVDADMMKFTGRVKVYESQETAYAGILAGEVHDEDVVVIRNEGPKYGMQEMLSPTAALKGMGIKAALATDGRFSGGTVGGCVGHISPEAAVKGPIAAVRDGDYIEINIPERSINMLTADQILMDEAEISSRLEKVPDFKPNARGGRLPQYSYLVTSADRGAVLRNPFDTSMD